MQQIAGAARHLSLEDSLDMVYRPIERTPYVGKGTYSGIPVSYSASSSTDR